MFSANKYCSKICRPHPTVFFIGRTKERIRQKKIVRARQKKMIELARQKKIILVFLQTAKKRNIELQMNSY